MKSRSLFLCASTLLGLALSGLLPFSAPALAQNTSADGATQGTTSSPGATRTDAAGQRGTDTGPTSDAGPGANPPASQTGVGARGTKVGPSTEPKAPAKGQGQ